MGQSCCLCGDGMGGVGQCAAFLEHTPELHPPGAKAIPEAVPTLGPYLRKGHSKSGPLRCGSCSQGQPRTDRTGEL